jgi:hypothetical protein
MGEIRRLQPAEGLVNATTGESKWGIPQRFLLVGMTLIVVACVIVSVLAYLRHSEYQDFMTRVERQRNAALHLPPWPAIQAFRIRFASGIETPMDDWFEGQRQRMAVGTVIAGSAGILGVILTAVGIIGLSRRKRS